MQTPMRVFVHQHFPRLRPFARLQTHNRGAVGFGRRGVGEQVFIPLVWYRGGRGTRR